MTSARAPSGWQRTIAWPERHPAASLLVLVLLFTLGAAAAVRAPVDRSAFAPAAALRVHAELPGFDPVTVERKVTAPLEALLTPLAGLRHVVARSRTGQAQVTLQFASAAARDRAVAEVRRRLAAGDAGLPAGMERPSVAVVGGGRAASVYAITAAAQWSEEGARWVRSILADPLRELPEIAAVEVEGLDQHEIVIQPDPRRLAGLGLGFDDLIAALQRGEQAPRRKSVPDLVVTPGPEAIAARAVHLSGGEPIALAEVARVSLVPRTDGGQPRHGSAPALRLAVYARSPQDAPRAAERVDAHLAWLRANGLVPSSVVIHPLHDESRATKEWRKRAVYHVGAAAGAALVIVLAAFGPRASGRVAAALIVWLPLAVAGLWPLGFTLNTATGAGLIVAGAPFVVLMLSALAPAGLLLAAVTAGVALAIGQALVGAPAAAAIAVSLLLGIGIRWLMRPWIPPLAGGRALPAGSAQTRGFLPGVVRSAATALPLLVVAAVVAAAFAAASSANGGSFRFRVHGADRAQLEAVIGSVLPSLHAIPRAEAITSSAERRETWRLHLDQERMREAGVALAQVGRALAIAGDGLIVGEIIGAERRLPLRLRLAPGAAGESFERLLLRGEQDKRRALYLRDIGFVERVVEPKERLRVDAAPAAEVTAQWIDDETREGLERFCERIEVPEGVASECVVLDSPV